MSRTSGNTRAAKKRRKAAEDQFRLDSMLMQNSIGGFLQELKSQIDELNEVCAGKVVSVDGKYGPSRAIRALLALAKVETYNLLRKFPLPAHLRIKHQLCEQIVNHYATTTLDDAWISSLSDCADEDNVLADARATSLLKETIAMMAAVMACLKEGASEMDRRIARDRYVHGVNLPEIPKADAKLLDLAP